LIEELKNTDALHTSFAWVNYNNSTKKFEMATLVITEHANQVQLSKDTQFNFNNYSLPLKNQAPVQITEEGAGNITGFTFEYPPFPGAPAPRQAFDIQLPLTGDARGTIRGQVTIGDLSANAATGWDASLYYIVHYNDKDIPQRYPIFNLQESGLQVLFDYSLDPVDPKNPRRSYLAFTGRSFILKQVDGKWTIENYSSGNQMPSYFRTVYGDKIELIPITTGEYPARLVFESLPPVDGKPRFYFAPAGDFELVVKGQEKLPPANAYKMIGGLSGAESIAFESKSQSTPGDVLRFESGKEAYAPVFPVIRKRNAEEDTKPQHLRTAIAQRSFNNQLRLHVARQAIHAAHPGLLQSELLAANKLLTDTYRTSWMTVLPNPAKPKPLPVATTTEGRGTPLTMARIDDVESMEDLQEVYENERRLKAMQQLTAVTYYSQPADAALYKHNKEDVQLADYMLQLRDTPAAYFTGQSMGFMPMVPYGGVSTTGIFGFNEINDFELQVLTPSRRDAVSNIPIAMQQAAGMPENDTPVLTTTPQGLLATVPQQGLNWQTVLLAKNESKGTLYNLAFTGGVTKELRDVMQSSQMFMVATKLEPLGGLKFLNKIPIADWPFTIRTGKGSETGNFSNVLIFKFASGSLEERIRDHKSWSSGGIFNDNPALVSNWISSYIENAKLSALNNSRFKNFVDIVQNPAWNGILALQVDIGVDTFPDDLKGLLGGIDRSQFFAHHFGIEVNFVKPKDGELDMPKSSLFGLINYVDRGYRSHEDVRAVLNDPPFSFSVQEPPSPTQGNTTPLYDFRVLTLQVVFANSDIQDFTSRIQLTTTQWFGEPAQLNSRRQGNSLNQQSIEFNGSYENHNGVRTYTFVTSPGDSYRFLLQSQAMNYVEIVKAQFNTLKVPDPMLLQAGKTETVFSRFVFWGYMNFKLLESFDLYSFGDVSNTSTTPRQGLYFTNLAVDMKFDLDSESGDVTNRGFSFAPDRIAFDISLSTPRVNSMFTNFPIRLSGLINAKGKKSKPPDLGYLPVIISSPVQIKTDKLGDDWFSLIYDLNLGSMGALAAKAGFVSQISTAWSPDVKAKRIAVGIKLPGVGGGQKTLSLQSVLNVNIQSFTFISEYQDDAQKLLAYLLRFNNVKLSLLGKKLPGAADTQFILFGDPTGNDKTTLAWYAAYFRKDK
ncbi:MAG: hypothetical protein WCF67_09415, partial [Chitinophagaceae bacterium]